MKKAYMRPSMRIVQLQHQCQILAGSLPAGKGPKGSSEDHIWDPDDLDDDDESENIATTSSNKQNRPKP